MLNVFVMCEIFLSFPDSSMGDCIRQGPDGKEEVHTLRRKSGEFNKRGRETNRDDESPKFSSCGPKTEREWLKLRRGLPARSCGFDGRMWPNCREETGQTPQWGMGSMPLDPSTHPPPALQSPMR